MFFLPERKMRRSLPAVIKDRFSKWNSSIPTHNMKRTWEGGEQLMGHRRRENTVKHRFAKIKISPFLKRYQKPNIAGFRST